MCDEPQMTTDPVVPNTMRELRLAEGMTMSKEKFFHLCRVMDNIEADSKDSKGSTPLAALKVLIEAKKVKFEDGMVTALCEQKTTNSSIEL
jgi:hypothetical protein